MTEKTWAMDALGLVNAGNLPVAVVHYTAPALVLLYFVSASSVPSETAVSDAVLAATAASGSGPVSALRRRIRPQRSNLVKLLFLLALLTFVHPSPK